MRDPSIRTIHWSLLEQSHGAKTHGQEFEVCDGDMGALASTGRCNPEGSRIASPSTRLDRTSENHDILVRRMCVDWDDGATGKSRPMNRPVLNWLRQRQQCYTR